MRQTMSSLSMSIIALFMISAGFAHAQNKHARARAEEEPYINFNPEVLKDANSPFRTAFDVVVVINKAKGAQTIDVYRFGEWVKHSKVSTGSEKSVADHGKYIFTQTYTGFFTPPIWEISIDHHSTQFDDAHMPYAVFFNNGEATHQAPPGTEPRLGTRASHGCVRNFEDTASDIFWMVALSGGSFSKNQFTAWCRLSKDETEYYKSLGGKSYQQMKAQKLAECEADPNWVALTELYQEQAVHALQIGAAQKLPRKEWPQVPNVGRATGEFLKDPVTGIDLTHPGYRTLYIVEDVEPAEGQDPKKISGPTGMIVADSNLLVSRAGIQPVAQSYREPLDLRPQQQWWGQQAPQRPQQQQRPFSIFDSILHH